jgi:AcrR family transcriptional regulator
MSLRPNQTFATNHLLLRRVPFTRSNLHTTPTSPLNTDRVANRDSLALTTPAMATRNSLKGAETRKAILDASEILFSQHGYQGTALRDIAATAQVRQSLVHYHFGNKHEIFSATVERKLGMLVEVITQSFADADRAASGRISPEQTVSAFVMPFLTIAATRGHELRYYVMMTSHLMSSYRLPELREILQQLGAVSALFEERVHTLMPKATTADVLAGIYLIEAALIFMVQDSGFLDDLTRNSHSVEALNEMARPAISFFSAGLIRLIDKPI